MPDTDAREDESPENVRDWLAALLPDASVWRNELADGVPPETQQRWHISVYLGLEGSAALADRLGQAAQDKAAVERVRAMHVHKIVRVCPRPDRCAECLDPWRCRTIRALDGTAAEQ